LAICCSPEFSTANTSSKSLTTTMAPAPLFKARGLKGF
jgi:hypothetical protein